MKTKENQACNICGKRNKSVKKYKAALNAGIYFMCDKCRAKTLITVELESSV